MKIKHKTEDHDSISDGEINNISDGGKDRLPFGKVIPSFQENNSLEEIGKKQLRRKSISFINAEQQKYDSISHGEISNSTKKTVKVKLGSSFKEDDSLEEIGKKPLLRRKSSSSLNAEQQKQRNIEEIRDFLEHGDLGFLDFYRRNHKISEDAISKFATDPSYEAFKVASSNFIKQADALQTLVDHSEVGSEGARKITTAKLEAFETMQKQFQNFLSLITVEYTQQYYTNNLKQLLNYAASHDNMNKQEIRNEIATITKNTFAPVIDHQRSDAVHSLMNKTNEVDIQSMMNEYLDIQKEISPFSAFSIAELNYKRRLEEEFKKEQFNKRKFPQSVDYQLLQENIEIEENDEIEINKSLEIQQLNEKHTKSIDLLERNAEKFAAVVLYRIENEDHYTVWQTICNMVNDFIGYLGTKFNIETMKPIDQKLGLDAETVQQLKINPKVIAKETKKLYADQEEDFEPVRQSLQNRSFLSRLEEEQQNRINQRVQFREI